MKRKTLKKISLSRALTHGLTRLFSEDLGGKVMTLEDYHYRKVPEYYDYMYLDGFTPDEIMYAARKKFNREYAERLAREKPSALSILFWML